MSEPLAPASLPAGRDMPAADWQQAPLRVRVVVCTLLQRLQALETRLHQNSSNSSRPPSTDAPAPKCQRRVKAAERRKPGGQPGHPGHTQILFEPTATVALCPEGWACGHHGLGDLTLDHTHHVIELPRMAPEVTPWMLPQGSCLACGPLCKASLPGAHASG